MAYMKFLRWAVLGLLSIILIVPFIVADFSAGHTNNSIGLYLPIANMFFPFITGKNFAFRFLVELLLGFYLLLAFKDPKYRPHTSLLMWVFTAWVGWMALATIFSVDPSKSFWSNFERMEGYIGLLHGFVYFVIAGAVITAENWWYKIFNISIALATLQGINALLQFMHLWGLSPSSQSGGRADGTLGNATYLAVYMMFNFFLTLYMLVRERKNTTAQVLYGIALVFTFIGVYFSETRGALLGLIGGLIVAGLWIIWRTRGEAQWRTFNKIATGGLITIVVLAGLFMALRNTSFIQNSALQRLASISLEDKTTQSRFLLWNMALHGVAEKPVLGWGQENFSYVFNKYYVPEMYDQEQWFDRAHNAFIDWLIAGGIPAFLMYVSLFVLSLWTIVRSKLHAPEQALLLGLVCAYGFNNIFVFDNLVSYLYFFLVLAYVHSLAEKKPHKHMIFSRPMHDHGIAIAAPIVLVGVVALMWGTLFPGITRAKSLIDAIQPYNVVSTPQGLQPAQKDVKENIAQFNAVLTDPWPGMTLGVQEATEQLFQFAINQGSQQGIAPESKQLLFETAQKAGERLLVLRPHDARIELFMATFSAQGTGDLAKAATYYQAALQDSPKKQQILIDYGYLLIRAGQVDQGVAVIKQAYEEDTNYDVARISYVIALLYTNKLADADKVLTNKYGTTLVDDNRLMNAYQQLKLWDRVLGIWQLRAQAAPNDPQIHISMAQVYFQLRDTKNTIAELTKAKTIAMNLPTPNLQLVGEIDSIVKSIQNGTLKPQ